MPLTLILTRHAKSSRSDPTLPDHDRPLNARGIRAAAAVGRWIATHCPHPQTILCSDAARTRETWALIANELPSAPVASFRRSLYLADPDAMLAELAMADTDVVMMIAHNPGCALLAHNLLATPPRDDRLDRFPTAATALIEFPAPRWPAITPQSGTLRAFTTPRDLI